jgi:hypothetical protein
MTPLMRACRAGKREAADLLLAYGASVHARDAAGRTPLHHAALSPCEELVDLLLGAGARLEERDFSGRTPLQSAAEANNLRLIRELRLSGAATTDLDLQECSQLALQEINVSCRFALAPVLLAEYVALVLQGFGESSDGNAAEWLSSPVKVTVVGMESTGALARAVLAIGARQEEEQEGEQGQAAMLPSRAIVEGREFGSTGVEGGFTRELPLPCGRTGSRLVLEDLIHGGVYSFRVALGGEEPRHRGPFSEWTTRVVVGGYDWGWQWQRFSCLSKVGEGSSSMAFLAKYAGFDQQLVIKAHKEVQESPGNPHARAEDDFRESFRREIAAYQKLQEQADQEAFVGCLCYFEGRVVEYDSARGLKFYSPGVIVMRYGGRHTLEDVVSQGLLEQWYPSQAARTRRRAEVWIAQRIAAALCAMHRLDLIHFDLALRWGTPVWPHGRQCA